MEGLMVTPIAVAMIMVVLKGKSFTGVTATLALLAFVTAFYRIEANLIMLVLAAIPGPKTEKKNGRVVISDSEVVELLVDKVADDRKLQATGVKYKSLLNTTGKALFDRIKFYAVKTTGRDLDDVSRGSFKLREILAYMGKRGRTMQGAFVDLCAGPGGWSQVMDSMGNIGTAISFWKLHPKHEPWKGPSRVRCIESDIGDIEPFSVDIVLCDGGEEDPSPKKEGSRHAKLLRKAAKWVIANPNCDFIIKVLGIYDVEVLKELERIQLATGKGRLIRLRASRLSSNELYFISLDKRPLLREAYSAMMFLISSWSKALKDPPKETQLDYVKREPVWDQPATYAGLPRLEPFDMTASVEEATRDKTMFEPRGITRFLKEVGYFVVKNVGSNNSLRNGLIADLLGPLVSRMPGLSSWKMTSTTARATFDVMMNKVDKAPVETHQYWEWMKIAYTEMAEYLVERGHRMRLKSDEEIVNAVNPKGAIGMQEHKITGVDGKEYAFANIGEYVKFVDADGKYLWRKRMHDVIKSFYRGKPILALYNSIMKKEKKEDLTQHRQKGSRLIWYEPATMRMFETHVFGDAEEVIKHLPVSVCGKPLYDFGEQIAAGFTPGRKAVADDIAGWDMRVSHGCLVMENMFWQRLATTKLHRMYINWLYRVYANMYVMIAREIVQGVIEMAIYMVYGKVSSGKRVTYAGNTVTNTARCMVSAAISQDVAMKDFRRWMRRVLRENTDQFGGAVAGDDSVLIFGEKEAYQYVSKAHIISNAMGFIRKGLGLEEESVIVHRMEDVDFCSNNYTLITYLTDKGKISRWMPIRPLTEIFAKTLLTISPAKDDITEQAWAKCQALNLLVNYHHMPEARALGLVILSVVDPRVVLQGLSVGWTYQAMPWITDGNVLKIVSNCLFGNATTVTRLKSGAKIKEIRHLGQVDAVSRRRFGGLKRKLKDMWYKHLVGAMDNIRKPGRVYENWYVHMRPLAALCCA